MGLKSMSETLVQQRAVTCCRVVAVYNGSLVRAEDQNVQPVSLILSIPRGISMRIYCIHQINTERPMTLAMVKTDNTCSIGIALLSPKEKSYRRKLGYTIASGRAVKNPSIVMNNDDVDERGGPLKVLLSISDAIRIRLKSHKSSASDIQKALSEGSYQKYVVGGVWTR